MYTSTPASDPDAENAQRLGRLHFAEDISHLAEESKATTKPTSIHTGFLQCRKSAKTAEAHSGIPQHSLVLPSSLSHSACTDAEVADCLKLNEGVGLHLGSGWLPRDKSGLRERAASGLQGPT